jgi:hypothetical protein
MPIPFLLPSGLPSDPDSSALDRVVAGVEYSFRVRNSSLLLVGEVSDWARCTIIPRFNNVGQCTFLLNANDEMAPYLATPGYGLIISRRVMNAAGVVLYSDPYFFTGDVWNVKRVNSNGQKSLQIVAYDDLRRVASRDAWTVPNYPYSTLASFGGPFFYYRLGDTASSAVATDDSGFSNNGTYTTDLAGGYTGLIDDEDTCWLGSGAGYISVGSTALAPTGNSSFAISGWFKVPSYPAANAYMFSFGTNAVKSGGGIYLDTTGHVHMQILGGGALPNISSLSAISTDSGVGGTTASHHVYATWDGTTMSFWLDGVLQGTSVPGVALTLTYGTILIGAFMGGTQKYAGYLDEWEMYSTSVTSTTAAQLYAVGHSRFAYIATDEDSDIAEDVIKGYVDRNIGALAITERKDTLLTTAASSHLGSVVYAEASFDKLIARDGTGLLQRLALASSPVLGFKVTQSGTSLSFIVYQPTDRSASINFSEDIGNLGDFSYELTGPDWETGGNSIVVGGSGSTTSRVFYLITNTSSVSAWGRVEQFIDQSNTSDPDVLADAASSMILRLKDQSSMTLQLMPQRNLTYGMDYNLGDSVTYVIDGNATTDIVREVQIDLDPNNGETVTPAVGSPNTAALMHDAASYVQQTQQALGLLRNRLANVERRK